MSKDQNDVPKAVWMDALLEVDLLFGKLKREVVRKSFVVQWFYAGVAVCAVVCHPGVLGALEKKQEHEEVPA